MLTRNSSYDFSHLRKSSLDRLATLTYPDVVQKRSNAGREEEQSASHRGKTTFVWGAPCAQKPVMAIMMLTRIREAIKPPTGEQAEDGPGVPIRISTTGKVVEGYPISQRSGMNFKAGSMLMSTNLRFHRKLGEIRQSQENSYRQLSQ